MKHMLNPRDIRHDVNFSRCIYLTPGPIPARKASRDVIADTRRALRRSASVFKKHTPLSSREGAGVRFPYPITTSLPVSLDFSAARITSMMCRAYSGPIGEGAPVRMLFAKSVISPVKPVPVGTVSSGAGV